ncbi:major histocompatibility complex class I-related gene protein-like [Xiphias gladius]|uniref:major histocompatibility complex class I-related gene protein-like n=1 Tax=Xiphias gladius TaxID=8245 RepID=UPI001A9817A6|nr:major histocompatibility complex class I-related gene protein-like [Xiphias gladius]
MKKLFLLLLFCHVSSPVKHSLKYFLTASSGIPNFPDVLGAALVDDIQAGYCDTDTKIVEAKQDWMKTYFDNDPQHLDWYTGECFEILPKFFKARIQSLKQRLNQSEGVHILQRTSGCELDEKTGKVIGIMQFGYDGEDFISLDLKTLTWIAPKPQAFVTKHRWDADKGRIKRIENFCTQICPEWLKKYLAYGKSSLLRKELPSVSLLQKTPSSPVSCHATGFYPDRAVMFWRKGGEKLHEDVDQGEILPNHDGTFQMSVDLNISLVPPEDWKSYECVFHFSGVENYTITTLDKAVIRTNWEKPSIITPSIIAAVVVVALVVTAVTGFLVYKKKKAKRPPSSLDTGSELSEKLNVET